MSNEKNKDEERQIPEDQQEQWESLEDAEGFDEYGEYEDFEDASDDLELEEKIRLNPKKIVVFGGLFILAVLICIPLWMLTHKKIGQEAEVKNGENPVQETQTGMDGLIVTEEPASTQPPSVTREPAVTEEPTVSREPVNTPVPAETDAPQGTRTPVGTPPADEGSGEEMRDPISGNASMSFIAAEDSVTAKDVTNLRSVPSTEDSENVVGQLQNGEVLSRTGLNSDTGWSKLDYNGQTVYAVTRYLTTDLTYKPPVTASNPNRITTQEGRVIIFTDCDDYITPKEYVNLRTEPSTSQGDATVSCQVRNGESVHRTGYSPDSGWSRVDYNGETLYVVTNYVVSAPTE